MEKFNIIKTEYLALEGNVFSLNKDSDFNKGVLDGITVTKIKYGELQLSKIDGAYLHKGVFTSHIINTASFSKLVASWNADTPQGTSVEVEVQVFVDGQWSDWISWGHWSIAKERASVKDNSNTKLAGIWTDTLYVRGGKTSDAFKLRVILNSEDLSATPVLRAVNATIDLSSGARRGYPANEDTSAIENVDKIIDVPAFSQIVRDPKIAGSICSATSAACVIDYYLNKNGKLSILPEESAWAVYDSVYEGFGNWAFTTAFIGSFGLNSKVVFCSSLYDLKRQIYNGRPVIISVNKVRSAENTDPSVADFTVVHGFPISSTRGHLITVTGFTNIDGIEYVCVNDSAAANDSEVKRRYDAAEFDAAWANSGRIAYFVDDDYGPIYNPVKRLPAVLLATENSEKRDNENYHEFQLKYNGAPVDMSNSNAKTIMVLKNCGKYEYFDPDAGNNNLWIPVRGQADKYSVLIIAKDNTEYTADIIC